MDIRSVLHRLSEFQNLSSEEMYSAIKEIVDGNATDAQIGAFIIATKMKGETVEEIEGAGRFFRERATKVEVSNPEELVDTCGTGGDKSGTFNVSTVTAFVLAGAGVRVAKHGNRSVSSKCGSADFLEQAGAKIDLPAEKVAKLIEEIGIGFMFAPLFHPAMKRVIGPRREVGVRSIFNLLGPLSNPAGAKRQILGVFSDKLVDKLAHVLKRLGIVKAFVVHGKDGIDEVSIADATLVGEVDDGEVKLYEFIPEELGVQRRELAQVCITSPEESFRMGFSVLEGEEGPHRDIVLLNATFGILASGKVSDRKEAFELARESIDSGRAKKKLEDFIELSNRI
ncbi:anthranilate phosphoribosyltransferase [Hydrogenivirga sp. 128-5-R1-1]|uniref:anthranilate phosphoribosyltransferase n=1 Tax=Hydrogenivirga sp. 128-5-R1-1 TaxID=392423 RepID=UPI00015F2D67|nr:anthranilate phosphoribosyltransferase [Hydrogenivirga sp. 128-5-R1-1]EDP74621.1 phosphoribosylanthranilate transferase [Hydrogenivirga sp. 128-5-R1-1]